MHLIHFYSKNSIPVEEGSILKYLASEYKIDEQIYGHALQVIGDPVTGDNAGITHYNFSTIGEEYKTHIKIV